DRRIHPIRLAKDLMAFPVKTVPADETITGAGEILTRYNINVLPVTDNGGVAGLITRQTIEKAAFHGFKDSPVRDYMNTEFATVTSQTPLSRVQDLIVGNNQRFLPVVDKGKRVGAITRTDLLRWLYTRGDHLSSTLAEPDFHGAEPHIRGVFRMMEERLPADVLALLKSIGRSAEELGMQVYLVGGFVRDLLLRNHNLDIDVVVEGDGIRLAVALAEEGKARLRVHRKFGTATLELPSGYRLDIATARLEYYDRPAALPRVEHGSIKLDLSRRDFTVNALAIHLNPRHFGELIDFFGGQKDLKERLIRVLHNLSFVEDPTRIFRALRFEQRIGFQIARQTHMLMENAVRMELMGRLSGRRLFRELVLCLSEEKAWPVVKRMGDYDLLKFFHPALKAQRSLEAIFLKLEGVISWYRLLFTGEKFEPWVVYLLGLSDALPEKEIPKLLERSSLPEQFRGNFLRQRRAAMQAAHRLSQANLGRAEICFLLKPLPTDFLLWAMARA
ncbi:MAG TPA: CBS domain-containing protein, partial [Thermodesulfobacteriota bacterium]|nr:CBS domain-containing protein [Thermodesulfobacteriota bacterium]